MDVLNKKHFLTVKDHSVSKEIFELYHDENLDMLITSPQPDLENLEDITKAKIIFRTQITNVLLFEKAYHFVKNIALKNKLNLINSEQSQKGRILDIGAGTGDFLLTAKNDGWET